MKPTVKDIAKKANVSPGTVSNALNNKKGVSYEVKKVVFQAAKELGYCKEAYINKNSIRFLIYIRHGCVVSDTPFFSSLIEGIEKECRIQGYEMLISHVNVNDENYREVINNINNDHLSGLLILATEMYGEDVALFKNESVPVVILDSYFKTMDFDSVLINNTDAAYKATSYLVDSGHVNIGYLHSSIYINNFYYRKQGYLDALSDHGLKAEKEFEILLESTLEGAYQDMKKALQQDNLVLPTAFFADNDIIAFGAIRALKEKGYRVPEDISVIGLDDMPFCEIASPRLTTIRVFKQEMGRIAVKRLIQKIEAKDNIVQKIEINTELIIRESVLKI